jgi:hypothetical protein
METLLQDHDQGSKRRAQELAGELISNSVMPDTVQQELEEFVSRLDKLEAQVL